MPGGSAPEPQQAVAGWALCTGVGPFLLSHHERAASGVWAVELAGLRNGGLGCQLPQQTHEQVTDMALYSG